MPTLDDVLPSATVRVETPDGTAFVIISEDGSGRPVRIEVIIGKAGAALAAWAYALSNLMTTLLQKGLTLEDILYDIAGISSDKVMARIADRPSAKSGPDGIAKAIIIYLMRRRR